MSLEVGVIHPIQYQGPIVAYVPNYLHDVFISYRWADNSDAAPWVTRFHRHLHTLLKRIASTGTDGTNWDYSIFRDKPRIEGNAPLPDTLAGAVGSSATLLVVMSDTYSKRDSKWCEEERRLFRDATVNQPDQDRRVFVIDISHVPYAIWPDQFSSPERTGYQFWQCDEGTGLVRPISMEFGSDGRFPVEFERLAKNLFSQLNRLLPSRCKWNVQGMPGHCFVREEDGSWIQLPERWTFREEQRIRDRIELIATDIRRYGIRLYPKHCEIRDGATGWGLHAHGSWAD